MDPFWICFALKYKRIKWTPSCKASLLLPGGANIFLIKSEILLKYKRIKWTPNRKAPLLLPGGNNEPTGIWIQYLLLYGRYNDLLWRILKWRIFEMAYFKMTYFFKVNWVFLNGVFLNCKRCIFWWRIFCLMRFFVYFWAYFLYLRLQTFCAPETLPLLWGSAEPYLPSTERWFC